MKPAPVAAVLAMLALAISCRASGAPNQGKTAMDTLSGKLAVAPARIASTSSGAWYQPAWRADSAGRTGLLRSS